MALHGVLIEPATDYRGRTYAGFYARRDPATGPGWYVFARALNVSATVCRLMARPDVPARKVRSYNGKVRRGWQRKAEAEAFAAYLNVATRGTV